MSFWLGLSILVVGFFALAVFGVLDRLLRWVLPEDHFESLAERGTEFRGSAEAELYHRRAQAGAQWSFVEGLTGTGGASGWVQVAWGVGLLAVAAVLIVSALWWLL